MKTRYRKKDNKNNKNKKNNKTRKTKINMKKMKPEKKWKTAIDVARDTLKKTGSLEKAKMALDKQALFNARKLFGSV